MRVVNDFTFSDKGQEKDETIALGMTRITDNLYFGGEDDIDDVLSFIDVLVDLRHENQFNRIIPVPRNITYVRIPIEDGDIERAYSVFSKAKIIINTAIFLSEKVAVICNAGVSRSTVLVWWILAEWCGDPNSAYGHLKTLRPVIKIDERFYPFIRKYIYKKGA